MAKRKSPKSNEEKQFQAKKLLKLLGLSVLIAQIQEEFLIVTSSKYAPEKKKQKFSRDGIVPAAKGEGVLPSFPIGKLRGSYLSPTLGMLQPQKLFSPEHEKFLINSFKKDQLKQKLKKELEMDSK